MKKYATQSGWNAMFGTFHLLAFNHNCVCVVTHGDKFSYLENIFRILYFPMMSNKGAW